MSRTLGTVVRGVRAPIFREGDNVVDITVSTVLNALQDNAITARDGDVVAVTESVVARCQGNYATCEQIAADVRAKTGGKTVGVALSATTKDKLGAWRSPSSAATASPCCCGASRWARRRWCCC